MDSGHPTIRRSLLCCPDCGFELLETFPYYENHGVFIGENHVRTPLGEVRLTPGQLIVVMVIMEMYPRAATLESILGFYEFYVAGKRNREAEYTKLSIAVQLSKARIALHAIGLHVKNVWGRGWFIEIDFGDAHVSIPAKHS